MCVYIYFFPPLAAIGLGCVPQPLGTTAAAAAAHSTKPKKEKKKREGGLSSGQSNWSTSKAHHTKRDTTRGGPPLR